MRRLKHVEHIFDFFIFDERQISLTLTDITSSSGDDIANVNCFTTTSDTYYKYNRLAHKLWHKHRPHSVHYRPEATRNHHNVKARLKR